MPEVVAQEPGGEPIEGAPPAASEPDDWQAKATEWQKRATGWQAQFQALQQEKQNWESAQQKLTQDVAESKKQLGTLVAEKATWEQVSQEAEVETEKLVAEYTEATAKLQKYDLIHSEFPDLFKFTDLIPTAGNADEQRTTLGEWNELMSSHIETEVQRQVELATRGVSPPASPARGVGAPSEEELAARLSEIAGKPGFEEEYEKLSQLWSRLGGA